MQRITHLSLLYLLSGVLMYKSCDLQNRLDETSEVLADTAVEYTVCMSGWADSEVWEANQREKYINCSFELDETIELLKVCTATCGGK